MARRFLTAIELPGDPTLPLHATTKRYADEVAFSRYPLDTGEETMPREMVSGSCSVISSSLRLSYFAARKGEITTQLKMFSGATAAGATPTLVRMGLYTIAANGDGTLVASTANNTSLFATAHTGYTRSWSTAYTKVADQLYALGFLLVSTATIPTMAGRFVTAGLGSECLLPPQVQGAIASQSNLPSSFTAASVVSATAHYYGALI